MALGKIEGHCGLCGRDEEWHKENKPRHPYLGNPSGLNNEPKPEGKVVKGSTGVDIALRMALVEAGVISYGQIVVSEERLRNAAGRGEVVVVPYSADEPGVPEPGSSPGSD